jgi:hypothetical protein
VPVLAAIPVGYLVAAVAVTTVASTAVSIYGAEKSAAATSAASAYQSQVATINQGIADTAAKNALLTGDVQQQQKANQEAQLLGQQKVAMAANGGDPNSGSDVSLESDTKANGLLDQLTIQSNAERENLGYQTQSMSYQGQAALDQASSQNALTAGNLQAGATALSGAGSVASSWYNMNYGTRQQMPAAGGLT